MRTLKRLVMAAAAVVATLPVFAGNENQTTGSTETVSWEYWNDVKENGDYYPNWKVTLKSGTMAAVSDNTRFIWTLKKDGQAYKNGEEGTSWVGDDFCTAYCHIPVLAAGEYEMSTTVRFIKGGVNNDQILDPVKWTSKGPDTTIPVITLTCSNLQPTSATEGTFDYKLEVQNAGEVENYVIWANTSGEKTLLEKTDVTALSGTLQLKNLNPGAETHIWVKVQAKLKNGNLYPTEPAQYPGEAMGYDGFIIDTSSKADFKIPEISVVAGTPEPTGLTTGRLPYTLTVSNADDVEDYRIYVLTKGDVPVSDVLTTTALSGTIDLKDLNYGDVTELWLKVQANVRGAGLYPQEAITYPGAAQGWTGLSIDTNDGTTFRMPTLTLNAYGPKVTGETTGQLRYAVTADYPEGIATYDILVVTAGDKEVGKITTDEAEGIIELSDLTPGEKNELWVKATATLSDGRTTAQVQYPGEAQGWTGLSIDMSLKPGTAMPTISLMASNPTAVTLTTGTVDYELTVIDGESVDTYTVWVVTTGEKILGQTVSGDHKGSVSLSGLNSGTVTDLWMKVFATLVDGTALGNVEKGDYMAQYPGEAQGWTGLSIDTTGAPDDENGISEVTVSDAAVTGIFDLQGRRVERMNAGSLYIVRHADGTVSKQLAR